METNSNSPANTQKGDTNPLPVGQSAPKAQQVQPVDLATPPGKKNEIAADTKQESSDDERANNKHPYIVQIIENAERNRFEKRTILLGWFGVGLGFLSLLAACLAGYFIYHQWWEMNAQTGYMNSAANQARHDSAAASKATVDQLRLMQGQLTQQEASTKATEEAMRTDQRAWVEQDLAPGIRMTDNAIMTVPIKLTVRGKTPAQKVEGIVVVTVRNRDQMPDFVYKTGHPRYRFSIPVLWSDAPRTLPFEAQRNDGKGGIEILTYDSNMRNRLAQEEAYL